MKLQFNPQNYLGLTTFLMLLVGKECRSELRCYVCDHCDSITQTTPMLACDADYFNTIGAVMPSTMMVTSSVTTDAAADSTKGNMTTTAVDTTTSAPTKTTIAKNSEAVPTTTANGESPKTNTMTSTSETSAKTTATPSIWSFTTEKVDDEVMNTTTETTTTTTANTMPENVTQTVERTTRRDAIVKGTPQAEEQGPRHPKSASSVFLTNITMMTDDSKTDVIPPTVANGDVFNTSPTTSRAYMNSSTFRVRQARHVMPAKLESEAFTYHCYTEQVVVNSTLNTRRGCARVTAMETVCGQLKKTTSPDTAINQCRHCSTDRCNGSSALSISLSVALLALVAILLKQ